MALLLPRSGELRRLAPAFSGHNYPEPRRCTAMSHHSAERLSAREFLLRVASTGRARVLREAGWPNSPAAYRPSGKTAPADKVAARPDVDTLSYNRSPYRRSENFGRRKLPYSRLPTPFRIFVI